MAWGEEDLISPKIQFPEAGRLRPQGPLCWPPGWEQGFRHPAPQSWTFRTAGSWGPRGLEGRRVKGNRAALPGVPTLRACLLKMLEAHQASHDSFSSAPSFLKCMCSAPQARVQDSSKGARVQRKGGSSIRRVWSGCRGEEREVTAVFSPCTFPIQVTKGHGFIIT